jgi:hypothetical protein
VQNCRQRGGRANFLRHFIWSRVSRLIRFRDESDKGTASNLCKSHKKCDTDPRND